MNEFNAIDVWWSGITTDHSQTNYYLERINLKRSFLKVVTRSWRIEEENGKSNERVNLELSLRMRGQYLKGRILEKLISHWWLKELD